MSGEKHPIKINLTAGPYGSTIEIDGVRIHYVKSIKIDATVEKVTLITLEVLALDGVEITGEVAKVQKKTLAVATEEIIVFPVGEIPKCQHELMSGREANELVKAWRDARPNQAMKPFQWLPEEDTVAVVLVPSKP